MRWAGARFSPHLDRRQARRCFLTRFHECRRVLPVECFELRCCAFEHLVHDGSLRFANHAMGRRARVPSHPRSRDPLACCAPRRGHERVRGERSTAACLARARIGSVRLSRVRCSIRVRTCVGRVGARLRAVRMRCLQVGSHAGKSSTCFLSIASRVIGIQISLHALSHNARE